MTRVCDIEKMLYDWAPRDLALEWDNVGLLLELSELPGKKSVSNVAR